MSCMRFQYDPDKAAANQKKHGVSFADAEGVLQDPLAVTVEDPDAEGERRYVARNENSMRTEYDFSRGKRGAVIPQKGKTRISIFIDNAVLDAFRARAVKAGTGYQTMMNEALRKYLSETEQPVTEQVLRRVLREEMPEYGRSPGARPARKR